MPVAVCVDTTKVNFKANQNILNIVEQFVAAAAAERLLGRLHVTRRIYDSFYLDKVSDSVRITWLCMWHLVISVHSTRRYDGQLNGNIISTLMVARLSWKPQSWANSSTSYIRSCTLFLSRSSFHTPLINRWSIGYIMPNRSVEKIYNVFPRPVPEYVVTVRPNSFTAIRYN